MSKAVSSLYECVMCHEVKSKFLMADGEQLCLQCRQTERLSSCKPTTTFQTTSYPSYSQSFCLYCERTGHLVSRCPERAHDYQYEVEEETMVQREYDRQMNFKTRRNEEKSAVRYNNETHHQRHRRRDY